MTDDLRRRWSAALMNNYGTPPIALVEGSGAYVTDADGKRYLDLLGGIAVAGAAILTVRALAGQGAAWGSVALAPVR